MTSRLRSLALGCALATVAGARASGQSDAMADMASRTNIHGFTDVSYLTGGSNTGRTSAFGLGQFDLYITSAVADRLSFLGETVFEFDDASNEFVVDVERVIAQYQLSDNLRLEAGKVHTPLGYWNNAYHHGFVMQPTIERPQVVQFEDDGGPLPIHTVGLQLSGRDLTAAHLGFDVLVGNPLGNRPTTDNRNEASSVSVALHTQVTPALRIGVSGYRDRIVAGSGTPRGDTLTAPMTQTIAGAYVAWFSGAAEAIVEGHDVANRFASVTTRSPNWFAYAGVRVGARVVPYAMHEDIRMADGDPYFAGDRFRRETLGIRYEYAASAVLKTELRSLDRRSADRATELGIQLGLAF